MSDNAFQVNLAELDGISELLKDFVSFLTESLEGLDQRVSALHLTWTGPAATKHAEAHKAWATGAIEVGEGIGVMQRAAITAHQSYATAMGANLRMFGRE